MGGRGQPTGKRTSADLGVLGVLVVMMRVITGVVFRRGLACKAVMDGMESRPGRYFSVPTQKYSEGEVGWAVGKIRENCDRGGGGAWKKQE